MKTLDNVELQWFSGSTKKAQLHGHNVDTEKQSNCTKALVYSANSILFR